MLSGSLETVEQVGWQENVMPDSGNAVIRFGYMMASSDKTGLSPQAIFVDQPPNSTIPRHFHDNAQYQIFIAGSARMANHDVQPIAVHYAAHQTVYGPIVAGPEGLVYLTLRPNTEHGAFWWPVDRGHMSRTAARVQLTKQGMPTDASRLVGLVEPEIETLIAPAENGLASWIVRIPAGETLTLPSNAGGGRFLLVTAGSMFLQKEEHIALSIIWVGRDEICEDVRAGDGGAEVVIAQFPVDALN